MTESEYTPVTTDLDFRLVAWVRAARRYPQDVWRIVRCDACGGRAETWWPRGLVMLVRALDWERLRRGIPLHDVWWSYTGPHGEFMQFGISLVQRAIDAPDEAETLMALAALAAGA